MHEIKCGQCGVVMRVPDYINYAICEPCKGALASTQPKRVVQHLVEAAKQNER